MEIVLLGVLCVSAVKKDLLAGSARRRLEVLVLGIPLQHDFAPFPSAKSVVIGARTIVEPGFHVHPHAAMRISLHSFSCCRLRGKPRLNGCQPPACPTAARRSLPGPLNLCRRLWLDRSA